MKCLSFNSLIEMATFGSTRKLKETGSVGCSGIFLVLLANIQCVATSVTWTAPPPVRTQTNPADVRTVVVPVLNGSTQAPLRWNYTLSSGSNLQSTGFSINDGSGFDSIGKIFHSIGVTTIFNTKDYKTRFNISRSEVATLIINEVTEREEAVYECELETLMNKWRYRIQVIITVESSITSDSGNQTESEGSSITLFCYASGNPNPNITWTRVWENGTDGDLVVGNTLVIVNISRTTTGTYRCTAYNGIGNPVNRFLYVNVTYPAMIDTSSHKRVHEVAAQQSVTLDCPAEGNPQPTFTWTPCDAQQSVCHGSTLIIPKVLKDTNYSCKVKNSLGNDATNISLFIASDVINVTLLILGEKCTDEDYNQLWEKLSKMIDEILNGTLGYESVQLKDIRCGSIIVDLALKFNSTVRESVVLSILQDAVKNGGFGDFNIGAITGTRDNQIETTMATTPTSSPDNTTWIIVGVVAGVVIVLAVAGGVAWYVYKKRKCKKRDSKVHNNGSQGEAGGNVQGEGYVEVNKGYEERANRHSGGGKTSSVPPVLYDTAQTSSRGAVKGPPLPQYAVVDKSKKKPKKRQPGELQYAELAEFSTGQGGQRSSLSPTNRHTETQYADVNAM